MKNKHFKIGLVARVKGAVKRLWKKVFPPPWEKYIIMYTPDNREVWCRRRKWNCPLHLATIEKTPLRPSKELLDSLKDTRR